MQHSTTRTLIPILAIVTTLVTSLSTTAYGEPIKQQLSRSSSSIKFGVDSPSPALQMNGHLKDFTGTVILNPDGSAISELNVVVHLDSAQLPPDQMLQSIFLHSVLARLNQQAATFRSTSIERVRGNEYIASGSYGWHKKNRSATIPFQLIRTSPSATELRVLMRGGLTDATTPKELSSAAPGASQSSGWTRATLVFVPQKMG
jgi:polyisoprenoid-binding protein YceI